MKRVTLNATLQSDKPGAAQTPIRGLADSDTSSIAVTRHIKLIRPGIAVRAPGYAITHIISCKTLYHHPKALHRAYKTLCPLVEFAGDWYAGLVHNEYLQAIFAAFEAHYDSPDRLTAAFVDVHTAHLHKLLSRRNRAPFLRDPYIALSDRALPPDIPPYDPDEAMRLYDQLPADHEIANPTMDAIRLRGGSATAAQIRRHIIAALAIPQDAAQFRSGDSNELERRLDWVRDGLRRYGVIDTPANGVWALTQWGRSAHSIDPQDVSGYILAQEELEYLESRRPVRRFPYHDPVRGISAEMRDILQPLGVIYGDKSPISRSSDADEWKAILRRALLSMSPNAFVSLMTRLILEYQNIDSVEVTAKTRRGFRGYLTARFEETGDDPIRMPFQFLRPHARTSGLDDVREFRFSISELDRVAILLTTSELTASARREARSPGARVLLIDGNALMNRLRHLGWGIQATPEFTDIDTYYYANYHLIY